MIKVPRGKKDEPLEILWRDSASNDSWGSSDRKGRVLTVMTVGYLFHDEKDHVSVVQNVCDNEDSSCLMTIPRECITGMKRFRRK